MHRGVTGKSLRIRPAGRRSVRFELNTEAKTLPAASNRCDFKSRGRNAAGAEANAGKFAVGSRSGHGLSGVPEELAMGAVFRESVSKQKIPIDLLLKNAGV
jgi:hypothetical protein